MTENYWAAFIGLEKIGIHESILSIYLFLPNVGRLIFYINPLDHFKD